MAGGGQNPSADQNPAGASRRTRSQGVLPPLLLQQMVHADSLVRMLTSARRLTLATVNPGMLETRLQLAKQKWDLMGATHLQYIASVPPDEETQEPYVANNEYGQFEEIFLELVDILSGHLSGLQAARPMENAPAAPAAPATAVPEALPRISIPKFSGDLAQWESFCDLFTSMIVSSTQLTRVMKFQYLKTSLVGEALTAIENIAVTEQNFDQAWETVKSRYSNRHLLIFTHVTQLLSLDNVTSPKPQLLRQLVDRTRSILESLRSLDQPIAQWSTLIVVMTVLRLDSATRRAWELSITDNRVFPTFEQLEKFIIHRVQCLTISDFKPLNANSFVKPASKPYASTGAVPKYSAHMTVSPVSPCLSCSSTHALANCRVFAQLSNSERLMLIQKHRHCYNCLKSGHFPTSCTSKNNCSHCKKRHHPLLHEALVQHNIDKLNKSIANPLPRTDEFGSSSVVSSNFAVPSSSVSAHSVLLATAWIKVSTPQGRAMFFRALIDQGSERTFISENAAQQLNVQRDAFSAVISGIGNQTAGHVRQSTRLKLSSQYPDKAHDEVYVNALIMSQLTPYVPRQFINVNEWSHLNDLPLADRPSNTSAPISLLIGADVYGLILREGVRRSVNGPLAQCTLFGWILSGTVSSSGDKCDSTSTVTSLHVVSNNELNNSIEKFWNLEEIPKIRFLTPEECVCEQLFVKTTVRDKEGRYCVTLPFKQAVPLELGDSYNIALRCYERLERRLSRDENLSADYHQFLRDYLELGHMSLYEMSKSAQVCFIPHHPVIKASSTTTKVRVVFNASSLTSNGTSLNDHLYVGPKLQQDLAAILLRWRLHQFVCTADVTKMFRQIRVNAEQTQYQLILWRPRVDSDIRVYRLNTVTYGTAPAPYLALRVLQQLSEDECLRFPVACNEIPKNIYVDDVLFGASSLESCLIMRNELIGLTEAGCLPLRKWSSNQSSLLADLPPAYCELSPAKSFQEDEKLKVLGLNWYPATDIFRFTVSIEPPTICTKRTLLSHVSKLFDPLGLVSPLIIRAKILLQSLWQRNVDWDDRLPDDVISTWQSFCNDLTSLSDLRIPRWVGYLDTASVQLHGFSDASQSAFAAAVYLRVTIGSKVIVHLLTSKTRVAPVRTILSIPRLELSGADLLSKLLRWVIESLDFTDVPIYAWSDSAVTLHWIASEPARWKTFVANRVSGIKERLPQAVWRYVPTSDNPADIASRGATASTLRASTLWWEGASWLSGPESSWPQSLSQLPSTIDLEQKVISAHFTVTAGWDLADRYSDWNKLLRVTALLYKFILRLRKQPNSRILFPELLARASIFWYKYIQHCTFNTEIKLLREKSPLPKTSLLRSLDPFLDENDLLRVGGRLQNSPMHLVPRHPILLADHALTRLIVCRMHLKSLHGGVQLTLRLLCEEYWLVRAKNVIRHHIASCVICTRFKAALSTQKMSPLPSVRVTPSSPFQSVGLDYAGPFFIRRAAGRGHQAHKAYLALFVCLSVKALHLELVMDCSTGAFLAAFKRFCSRRGVPSQVYSDNGTNFVGGDREIRQAFRKAIAHSSEAALLSTEKVTWHFIPPASPHFGGVWEAGVRSVKHHLRRIVSDHTLTGEEFSTLICQIEACLNSRPLTPLPSQPDELPLTPGHFLIGRPLCALPEPSLLELQISRLSRWQLVQRFREQFWKVWQVDYLSSLQKRNKWHQSSQNLCVGDVVLLRQENYPPSKWPLGRVLECYSGTDGLVRVCKVKTASTELVRSIHKLCKLPVDLS